MVTSLQIFIGFLVALEVFTLLFSSLLIYCSIKVQPMNKPPGSLVLVEMIFIFLFQLMQLTYTIFDLESADGSSSYWLPFKLALQAIGIYCNFTNSYYEICIVFELYHRIRVGKNAAPFRKRAIIYHAVSHFLAFCFTLVLIVGYTTLGHDDEFIVLNFDGWIIWFIIPWLTTNLITFFTLIGMTAYKNSKLPYSEVKKFVGKIINYMILLGMIRILTITVIVIGAIVFPSLEADYNRRWAIYSFIAFMVMTHLVTYLLRMFDQYIQEFLCYKFKSIRYRMKDMMNDIFSRRPKLPVVSLNQNLIPVRRYLDDILIEKIEYQLISLTIAMLKDQDVYEEGIERNE